MARLSRPGPTGRAASPAGEIAATCSGAASPRRAAMMAPVSAARLSGLDVDRLKITVYVVSAVTAGIAGIVEVSYLSSAIANQGLGKELAVIAAAVIGGTALTGGRASIIASGVAALFLTQLGQLLRALGWTEPTQLIVQALVLLAVVLLRVLVPSTLSAARALRQQRTARPIPESAELESSLR